MSFRDDGEALRNRVDALEDELAQAKSEAQRLRDALEAKARAAESAEHGFTRGALVWIEWRGTWWRGSVLDALGGGQYRVHYTGWSSSWDEVVSRARLAPMSQRPPGREAPSGAMALVVIALVVVIALAGIVLAVHTATPSTPPADAPPIPSVASAYPAERVWVEWNGIWYEGTVLYGDTASGLVRIHYDAYSSNDDEDVPLERLRVRP